MLPWSQFFESICLFIALPMLFRQGAGSWRIVVWYLLVVTLGDWTGWLLAVRGMTTLWLYNIIMLIQATVLGFLFMRLPTQKASLTAVVVGYACFLGIFTYQSILYGFRHYFHYAHLVLSIWLVVLSLIYFYRLLKDESNLPILSHPPFWFVVGTFLFYLGSIAATVFFEYFQHLQINYFRTAIFTTLNLILYITWSIAFLCKYRKKTLY